MALMAGGCLCGRVRYVIDGAPLGSHLCHCRDCQRYTGSAFGAGMVFRKDAVRIEGELRTFDVVGTSGQPVHRHFCPTCGAGVTVTGDVIPDKIVVQAGTLDDPAGYSPGAEIHVQSALPWVHALNGFPHTRV